ncbi:hypothetical protein pb186bvf_008351 [Paramecium bursaria]
MTITSYLVSLLRNSKRIKTTQIKMISKIIEANLAEEGVPPVIKFISLKFVSDLIDTGNHIWIVEVAQQILPHMEKVAVFKKESDDEDRGRFLFFDLKKSIKSYEIMSEYQMIGNSYLRLTLECIQLWALYFPFDKVQPGEFQLSLYRILLQRLTLQKVPFMPIKYFKLEECKFRVSIQRPSIAMLSESRDLIKQAIEKGEAMTLKNIQYELKQRFYRQPKPKKGQESQIIPQKIENVNFITIPQLFKRSLEAMVRGEFGDQVKFRIIGSRMKALEIKLLEQSKQKKFVNQHNININNIINDKEKLLQEINKGTQIQKSLNENITNLMKENDQQKLEIQQLNAQLINTQQELDKALKNLGVHLDASNIKGQNVDTSQNFNKISKRKDLQIQRLEEQIQYQQQIITSQNESIDKLNSHRVQADDELFSLQQQNSQVKIELQNQQKSNNILQQQVSRLQEQVSHYKELVSQQKSEHMRQQSELQEQLQIQTINFKEVQISKLMTDEELRSVQETLQYTLKENSTLKDQIKKIQQFQDKIKTQQNFFPGQTAMTFNKTEANGFRSLSSLAQKH